MALSVTSRVWAAALPAMVALSCSGKSSVSCDDDSDCPGEQRCDSRAAETVPRLLTPCAYVSCTTTPCGEGFVCAPWPSDRTTCASMVCLPRCTSDESCEAELTCVDGLCELLTCDEAGAVSCPAHWRCDPEAALSEPAFETTSLMVEANRYLTISRGCVRKRCNEDDGFPCLNELWECAPEIAEDASGCLPLPCEVTGHCHDDEAGICMPASSAPRGSGRDYYGCVTRNCEEGIVCTGTAERPIVYCDPHSPRASAVGCVAARCNEGNPCWEGQVCEPGAPGADTIGCIRDPDAPIGGSGGSSGGGSSGGGSSGGGSSGTATGGARGDPKGRRRCIAR